MIQIMVALALCLIPRISALSIKPLIPAANLTKIFIQPNHSKITDIFSNYMTYYIDPNDSTNTKYLWLGTNVKINESSPSSQPTLGSYVLSDVFTGLFTEYPAINGRLDIANELSSNVENLYLSDQLWLNMMCTSPQTKDIMTCWINGTWINDTTPIYQIVCRLYFVRTNTFSDIINVTNDKVGVNICLDVLCFHDGYFIPYSHTEIHSLYNNTPSDVILYGSLIDLKGQVKYPRAELKNLGKTRAGGVALWSVSGDEFNPREVDSRASNLFMMNYEMLNSTTNVTYLVGLYGYYTFINDTRFPIYVYNETELKSSADANADIEAEPNNIHVLNWYSACCYISIYTISNYNYTQTVYGIITDTHGTKLDVAQYPHNEDILLVNGASGDIATQIIDLPMISSETVHYFGVSYGKPGSSDYADANVTIIRVYYLQYDENNKKYNLFETGEFDAVMLTNENYQFDYVSAYNLPGTNYICFVWVQYYYNDGNDYMGSILGQTFVVN